MPEQEINFLNPPQSKNLEPYKALLEINQQESSIKARQGHFKAYIMSVLLPPIGLYYFIKYFFFGETSNDNRKAAVICITLTVISLILNVLLFMLFFNQAIPKKSQNMDFIKEFITPENQKILKQLFQ